MKIKLILGPVPNNPIIDSIQSGNIRSIQFPIYRSIRSPAAAAAMLNKIGVCTVVRAPCYCNDNNEPCFPIPHGSDVAALIIAGLRALLSVLLHGRFSVASLHACYTIVLGNSSQISTAPRNSTCVFFSYFIPLSIVYCWWYLFHLEIISNALHHCLRLRGSFAHHHYTLARRTRCERRFVRPSDDKQCILLRSVSFHSWSMRNSSSLRFSY